MFGIFFSSHKNYSPDRKKMKTIFPDLIEMIDLFKKEKRAERKKQKEKKGEVYDNKGDNQFAITLQKKESEIFIDGLLSKLQKTGFKVLSKHDSILCKKSDVTAVKGFVMNYLNEVFGKGNYQLKEEKYD